MQPSAADGHNPHVPRELEICCYSVSDAQIAERSARIGLNCVPGAPRVARLRHLVCSGQPLSPSRSRSSRWCAHAVAILSMTTSSFLPCATTCERLPRWDSAGSSLGSLDSSGGVDVGRSAALLDIARQTNPAIEVTFHRAFDEVSNPIAAYQQLANLGFSRLLTSGLEPTAIAGSPLISELINDHGNVPIVMPGGSVRPDNVNILLTLGATNVHSSATRSSESGVDASMVRELASAVHPG